MEEENEETPREWRRKGKGQLEDVGERWMNTKKMEEESGENN